MLSPPTLFTKITLSDKSVCSIFEPRAINILRAQIKFAASKDEFFVGFAPYMYSQIITINDKYVSVEDILNLPAVDWVAIMEDGDASIMKLNI